MAVGWHTAALLALLQALKRQQLRDVGRFLILIRGLREWGACGAVHQMI